MLDCQKLSVDKKKTKVSKPSPFLSDTTANPNQLKTHCLWQSKRNASSKPQFTKQEPKYGNVNNLNLNSDYKSKEPLIPAQSKDQWTMTYQIDDSPYLEPKSASTCPARPPDFMSNHDAPQLTKASNGRPNRFVISDLSDQVSYLEKLNISIPMLSLIHHFFCLFKPVILQMEKTILNALTL